MTVPAPAPRSRLFTYTVLCLLVAGWLTYFTIQFHRRLASPVPGPVSPSTVSCADCSNEPPAVDSNVWGPLPPIPSPRPQSLLTPPTAATAATEPVRELGDDAPAITAAVASPAPLTKTRAVAHPSTVKHTLVSYDGFPAADSGKMFRVRCDEARALCVVENGRCVSLMELVPDVPHSCVIGFDENGNGGVAFVSATIRIE